MSPPARVVWIEIIEKCRAVYTISTSPPARVVWIEIAFPGSEEARKMVATREGGVD